MHNNWPNNVRSDPTTVWQPMLACRGLKRITLYFFYSQHSINTDMADEDFEALCEALPLLEGFNISSRIYNGEKTDMTPKATLRAIRSFAQHCPALERLAISVNASFPFPILAIDNTHQNSRLAKLKAFHFAHSRLVREKIPDAVKFMRTVLPLESNGAYLSLI
ncbi:hypothetical protein FRB93_006922 [Tulasnella sp. JGI-2019a]|nr:hypothetical protein FRB93_006922 [Tulasnella sp. JGI-2019a]